VDSIAGSIAPGAGSGVSTASGRGTDSACGPGDAKGGFEGIGGNCGFADSAPFEGGTEAAAVEEGVSAAGLDAGGVIWAVRFPQAVDRTTRKSIPRKNRLFVLGLLGL